MRTFISFIALLLFSTLVSTAQISFTESAPYKTYAGNYFLYFQSGDEMLAFKRDADNFILQKYNTKTLVQTSLNIYKDIPQGHTIEAVKEFNKRYYFFYSMADKAKKTATLYCREINFATGTFTGQPNVLITVSSELNGSFSIFTSFNDERLMVQYTLLKTHMNDDINHQTMGFYVYDKNLQLSWNKEVEMPYPEKFAEYVTQTISSDGSIYYVLRTFDKGTPYPETFADEEKKYRLELLKIEKDKPLNKTSLKLSSNSVRNMLITEVAPDEMLCAGFYNLKGANIPSLFVCRINSDGSNSDVHFDLKPEIVNAYEDKENKKIKRNKDIPAAAELNYFICGTIQKENNGDLLIIEECTNLELVDNILTYHYNDMIATTIDAQNNVKWMHRLPKRPFRPGSAFSYKLISTEKNDYILFFDHEENKDLAINEIKARPLMSDETVLTAYKINKSTGSLEKIILLDTKLVNGKQIYRLRSERIIAASPTELIFEAYKKEEEDVLIKLKGIE